MTEVEYLTKKITIHDEQLLLQANKCLLCSKKQDEDIQMRATTY